MARKKGFKTPKKTKEKISKTLKGRKRNWSYDKNRPHPKGMLGKKHSKETKIKMSLAMSGNKCGHSNKGRRLSKEWKEKISKAHKGNKHWNWLGGKSFEPYGLEFNEDLKEVIRNRDRRKCQICEKTELKNKRKLPVHHIDYNKQNNNPNNLISLCNRCHIKTNYNRKYWIEYFKFLH